MPYSNKSEAAHSLGTVEPGKKKAGAGQILIYVIFTLASIVVIIPMLYLISISFSSDIDIATNGYRLFPEHPTLAAYRYIFRVPKQILNAYGVSILATVMGTALGLTLSSTIAYTMTRKDYRYHKITTFYVFFTMLFNGGLVPWYIVVTKFAGIGNTIFALFLPYGVSAWFTMLMKGFMQDVPFEIIEAAKIDGAKEFTIFARVVLPLVKPGLATIGLFYAFAYWNDWWLAMLFISKESLVPLQYMLYRNMTNLQFLLTNISSSLSVDMKQIPTESTRMAMAVLATGPMLIVFPFFQKYFVKGLTVGSVKG